MPNLYGFQPRNTPAERRAFFDLIRQRARTGDDIEAILDEIDTLQALTTPTAWTNVTFSGTWVNSGSGWQDVQYRKLGDMVQLRGSCTLGAAVSGTTIFTLPVGFRPPARLSFATEGSANFRWFLIESTGTVNWYSPADIAPDTGSFHFSHQFSVTA